MRILSFVAASAMLAVMMASPVSAAPENPGPCGGIWWMDKTVGPAHVYGTGGCMTVDVKFMDCVWNGEWRTVANTGGVHVRLYTCDGPGKEAPYCDIRDASPKPVQQQFNDDCRIVIEPIGGCLGGGGTTKTVNVGPLQLVLLICRGSNPLPPAS